MDPTGILQPAEFSAVLSDLERRVLHSKSDELNRVIFLLSACCGLRRSEISGLKVRDFKGMGGPRPKLVVPAEIGKRNKRREIYLWWDKMTYTILHAWVRGKDPDDYVVAAIRRDYRGQKLSHKTIAQRWMSAIRILPPERRRQLSIHKGRHTFCSLALHGGRNILEVQQAAGHADITTTSGYLHLVDSLDEGFGDLFGRIQK